MMIDGLFRFYLASVSPIMVLPDMQVLKGIELCVSLALFLLCCSFPVACTRSPRASAWNSMRQFPAWRPDLVPTQLGANRAPDGSTLTVNSQYLMRDGKPWIPVMGEFHYTRYPEAYWEEEILKMKASGVEVIATYVIWIHHEEVEGQFDWSGQRNLRKFAELLRQARNVALSAHRPVGAWGGAQRRTAGLGAEEERGAHQRPNLSCRGEEFYAQIGLQLHGLLWKDGGPVIGIQIENEYAAQRARARAGTPGRPQAMAIEQRPRRALVYRHRLG
jgi:beta-galactosidase